MARKPRIHVPGGFYHVLLRGNDGQDIFFAKGDRERFSLLMQEGTERFTYLLHAFCYMSNHVHLIIQVGDIPLSKIIQNLSFRYTKYINKKKKRVGHLFQGRYKAILVDEDVYLLELVRYIHNNPVRAGLVRDPVDYSWSSHRVYLGLDTNPFLTTEWVLSHFGKQLKTCRNNFLMFVIRVDTDKGKKREEFYCGEHDTRVLGDVRFTEKILNQNLSPPKTIPLARVIDIVCSEYAITKKDLIGVSRSRRLSEARGAIGWLALEKTSATLTEVAGLLNRDPANISRAVRKISENNPPETIKLIGLLTGE